MDASYLSSLAPRMPQAVEPALSAPAPGAALKKKGTEAADGQLRKSFDTFVGEVFFGQMLKSMRKTVGKPAYFHGGRGEEVFQAQLDQVLAQKMTEASAEQFTGPMFELFQLKRS